MTDNEILEMSKGFSMTSGGKYFVPDNDIIAFARLIERATREADIAIAHDFIQYHMDFDKADECAAAIRNQK